MKRTLALILCTALTLVLMTACTPGTPNTGSGESTTETPSQTVSDTTPDSTDKPEESTPSTETEKPDDGITPLDFCKTVEGTWTSADDHFLDFSIENEKAYLFFAIWNAGGSFPAGEITAVKETAPNEYRLTLSFPEVPPSEDVSGSAAYTAEYILANNLKGTLHINEISEAAISYTYDEARQFPMTFE